MAVTSQELAINLKARDEASSVLQKAGRSMIDFGDVAKKAALGLGVAVAVIAAASVNAAADAQLISSQTASVLASTRGAAGMTQKAVEDLATSLSLVTPFEDDLIQKTENMILTFTNISKEIFPQVTETALNMARALGGEPVQQSIALGKALNDPIQGMTALRRVGVSFTEDQVKVVKALQESGDIMGAQKIILKELAVEFGGSARAAGQTFTGQLAIAQNALGNVAEAIGGPLIGALADLLRSVTPTIVAFGEQIPAAFELLRTRVIPPVVAAVQLLKKNWDVLVVTTVVAVTLKMIPALFALMASYQIAVARAGVSLAALALAHLAAAGVSIAAGAAMVAAIAGVALVAYLVLRTWHQVAPVLGRLFGHLAILIGTAFENLGSSMHLVWSNIRLIIADAIGHILDFIAPIIQFLPGDWQRAFWSMRQSVATSGEAMRGDMFRLSRQINSSADVSRAAWEAMGQNFGEISESIGAQMSELGSTVRRIADGFSGSLLPTMDDAALKAADLGSSLGPTGAAGAMAGLGGAAKGAADELKRLNDIQRDLTETTDKMSQAAANVAAGIGAGLAPGAGRAVQEAIGTANLLSKATGGRGLVTEQQAKGGFLTLISIGGKLIPMFTGALTPPPESPQGGGIPTFQHGGIVPGVGPRLVVAHGGERIGRGEGGITIVFNAPVYGMMDFADQVRRVVRDTQAGGGFRGVLPSVVGA